MCGRYTLTSTYEAMRQLFRLRGTPLNMQPRYNVAPTQTMPIVLRTDDGGHELVPMRWGLIPAWAKDAKLAASAINARAESVQTKPMFRSAFKSRRCLVPADGFYEWMVMADGKQPYRFEQPGRAPFAFAGLWEVWKATPGTKFAEPGSTVHTYTIVTAEPIPVVAPVHDRSPVIMSPDAYDAWLNPAAEPGELLPMLVPYRGEMTAHPVSRDVNTVKNDRVELLAPLNSQ